MTSRVFIGSSREAIEIARSLQLLLEHDCKVELWEQGVFDLSKDTLGSLLEEIDRVQFGVFVFSPDDATKVRGKENLSVRDNVLFEFGLFMGRLGRERTFFVMPRQNDLRLPTDLLGIEPATYDPKRIDDNPEAALGSAATRLRRAMKKVETSRTIIHNSDPDEIRDFMLGWIEGGGRVAIFTRDMSWAQDCKKTMALLRKKASRGELVVCCPKKIELLNSVPGAEVHVYDKARFTPRARFTIVRYENNEARVAVGRKIGRDHVIDEYAPGDHPAFSMAEDLVMFARAMASRTRKSKKS